MYNSGEIWFQIDCVIGVFIVHGVFVFDALDIYDSRHIQSLFLID